MAGKLKKTRRITLKDVKHVDLVPIDFIAEIASHPEWTIEDIGCYCVICFHLYNSGGKKKFDVDLTARLCRISSDKFETSWKKIECKFKQSGDEFYQKRVLKELRAARQRIQNAVDAGLKGAKKRWQHYSDPNSDPNGDPLAKRRRNEDEDEIKTISNSKERASSSSSSLRFVSELEKIINPRNQSDRTAFRNLTKWLADKILSKQFNEEIYVRVLDYAKEAKAGKSRSPIAVFFSTLRRELGYAPKGLR